MLAAMETERQPLKEDGGPTPLKISRCVSEWLRSKTRVTSPAGEDVEQEECSSIADESANLYSHYGNQCGMNLLQDPAKSLMGIHSEDSSSYYNATYSIVFIAILFIIARNWKQPRCPSTEE